MKNLFFSSIRNLGLILCMNNLILKVFIVKDPIIRGRLTLSFVSASTIFISKTTLYHSMNTKGHIT